MHLHLRAIELLSWKALSRIFTLFVDCVGSIYIFVPVNMPVVWFAVKNSISRLLRGQAQCLQLLPA